ncbi:MAG: hypothetical protein DRO39_07600 [Thermoprotei archaeon]|nr:MAG: hypothetical protein DRO39_07600 [Thermoprotei archaeon]
MKRIFTFLLLLIMIAPVLHVHAEVSGEKQLVMKPSMDIALFPRRLYRCCVQPLGRAVDGMPDSMIEYYECENTIQYVVVGGGVLALGNVSGCAPTQCRC